MANPEARFIITAKDQTAAAISSADRNLKTLQRSFSSIQTLMRGFGIGFGVNAFAGWIKSSLDAKNMTEQQLAATREAREALESMRGSSNELARSFGTALAPAIDTISKGLKGLNAAFFGASAVPLEEQANRLRKDIEAIEREFSWDRPLKDILAGTGLSDDQKARIAPLRAQLDALHQSQMSAIFGGFDYKRTEFLTDAERQQLESMLYTLPKMSQDEWVALETTVYNMNQELAKTAGYFKGAELLTNDEAIRLEEFLNELNAAKSMLTQEEWVDLESFLYDMNQMRTQALSIAGDIGDGFKRAFSDWMYDGEFEFKDFLRRMSIEFATSQLFDMLGSWGTGAPGGFGKLVGKLFGGARAEGGPVVPGKIYKVGEEGEEWFAPRTAGTIIPNGAGGGTVNVTVNNTIAPGLEPYRDMLVGAMPSITQATTASVLKALGRPRIA